MGEDVGVGTAGQGTMSGVESSDSLIQSMIVVVRGPRKIVAAVMEKRNRKVRSVHGAIAIAAVADVCSFLLLIAPARGLLHPPVMLCCCVRGLWLLDHVVDCRSCQVTDEAQRSRFVTWDLVVVA